MQLTHIEIQNIHSIGWLDQPLEPLTVICGPGASGKTTVLEAIRLAVLGELGRYGQEAGKTAGVCMLRRDTKDGLVRVGWQATVEHGTSGGALETILPGLKRTGGDLTDRIDEWVLASLLAPARIANCWASDRDKLIAQAAGTPRNEALVAFQHRLQAHTATLRERQPHLPPVIIQGDGLIIVGELPYQRCSRSERWLADLRLAVALAEVSGLRLVMIDDFDALDLPTRATVMRWLYGLTRDGQLETAIVAGTLKQAPNLAGAVWLPDQVREQPPEGMEAA